MRRACRACPKWKIGNATFDYVLPMRSTSAQGHAMALKAGTDMACTEYSGHLNESLAQARTRLTQHTHTRKNPTCLRSQDAMQ